MNWLTNRWTGVAAAIWIQSSCGASYTFSIYSPLLKSTQHYSQSTLDTVSVFKDIGANFGVLSGLLYSAVTPYGDGPSPSKKSRWNSLMNLKFFDVKPFVSRLLGQGDLSGFMNKIHEVVPMDQQPELLNKLQEGTFTLRIMYEQFQNILKMGPMSEVFSMLPGFGNELIPKGKDQDSQAKIKRYMTMMDSMTNEELDSSNPKLMNESRMMRIARGSGRQVREVMEMMEEYKRLAKIWSKMKGLKIPKKGEMSSLSRNMNVNHMSKILPPQMLKQIGGMGGLQSLMKSMGSNKDMMGMFGGGGEQ